MYFFYAEENNLDKVFDLLKINTVSKLKKLAKNRRFVDIMWYYNAKFDFETVSVDDMFKLIYNVINELGK